MIFKNLTASLSPNVYCFFINLRNRLRNKQHSIKARKESHLYEVTDQQGKSITICRRNRHNLYKNSISSRIEKLANDYHLNKIPTNPDDTFIDCGANIGELGVWANQNNLRYFAFEPEKLESQCCNINAYNNTKKTNNMALWKETKTLKFYSEPNSADSSVFEIEQYAGVTEVPAISLAEYVNENKIESIHIFKLEAEGAEPEILEGAIPILNKINYLSVDCGYERGVEKTHTFIQINDILIKHNFELINAEFKRVTALYKNKTFDASQHSSTT